MTHKVITLEFVVPTVLAIALGILCSIGAVYLTDKYLGPSISWRPIAPSPAAAKLLSCQILTGGFRVFVCCFPGESNGAPGLMTEPADFASRPWTQADNDKLRRLALRGLSSRAISTRMNRTETVVCSRARQLGIILRKIRLKQLQMG